MDLFSRLNDMPIPESVLISDLPVPTWFIILFGGIIALLLHDRYRLSWWGAIWRSLVLLVGSFGTGYGAALIVRETGHNFLTDVGAVEFASFIVGLVIFLLAATWLLADFPGTLAAGNQYQSKRHKEMRAELAATDRQTGPNLRGRAMPSPERPKRDARQSVPSPERVEEAALHLLAIRRLWLDGQLDMVLRGHITEDAVLTVMSDVHANWLNVAAHAWRGYELVGYGYWWLNAATRRTGYAAGGFDAVPDIVPSEVGSYCENYDPHTQVVIVVFDFSSSGDAQAAAGLWVRPPDTWTTPPEAWRQVGRSIQRFIDPQLIAQRGF